MKITPLIAGLSLIAGVGLMAGAPSKEVQLSTPTKKEAPSLSDKPRSATPDGPTVDRVRRGGLEDTIEIVSVREEKPDSGGRRRVTVRVHCVLVHYPKGVLTLGFNLKSATHFFQVASLPVLAGDDQVELSATITPVTWPKAQPFKLSVGLSAEPRPGQWSLLAAVAQVMKPTAAAAAPK